MKTEYSERLLAILEEQERRTREETLQDLTRLWEDVQNDFLALADLLLAIDKIMEMV